jgi:hypothetical protein
MWQANNDHYTLWRLAHEHQQESLDRLLNSVTVSDRSPAIVRPLISSLARVANRLANWLRSYRMGGGQQLPAAADEIVPTVTSKSS